ncbi:MAG: hypothetical protein K1X94_30230 [Sandaracinaceae bacterium]|nr:hypothetical protein [Sandaracinaceae bacterium]
MRRVTEASLLAVALWLVPWAHAQSDAGVEGARSTDAASDAAADPALEEFRALVDSDPFAGDDPVGGTEDGATVDPLAAEGTSDLRTASLPAEDELVSERLPIVRGEVLSAIAGVREVEHRTHVELVAGLAIVRTELRFESSARYAAEVGYRLAVPEGAAPFALEVCRADGSCRHGVLETSEARALSAYDAALVASGPIAQDSRPIAVIERADGARVLRAVPVPAAGVGGDGAAAHGALIERLGYAVPVPVHGGVARVTLPPRGSDLRAADEVISLATSDLVVPELDAVEVLPTDTVERRAVQGVEIVAHVPRTWTSRTEAWTAPCAGQRCVWVRSQAARPELARQDVILALDVSPSTSAGARGLVPEAAMSLLGSLPAGSRVRVIAVAARAEIVVDAWTDATEIEESALRRATDLELGSATRFDALWSAIEGSATLGTTVVWIGDGGLTSSDESARAIDAADARGLSLRVISVADRPSTAALVALAARFRMPIVEAHREALLAARHRREPLDERLAGVLASSPVVPLSVRGLGATHPVSLVAGGASSWSARVTAPPAVQVSGQSLAVTQASGDLALAVAAIGARATRVVAADASREVMACGQSQTVLHGSASLPRVTPLPNRFAVVERRACRPSAQAAAATAHRRSGLSPAALLRTLRQRILPRARDCFRSDRRGRAEYSTQVQLLLTLADQEIVDVRAEGAIEPALRACMVRAADGLEVPPFEGVILARWPLYSRPELGPPTLELHPDLASAIDAIGGDAIGAEHE